MHGMSRTSSTNSENSYRQHLKMMTMPGGLSDATYLEISKCEESCRIIRIGEDVKKNWSGAFRSVTVVGVGARGSYVKSKIWHHGREKD
ncbi:hypothetical protein VNO77_03338 [Canavalia gladiata]|uniref:Uncharacterized protein n=1 Tax=Canavalia gladiata TaxID=3824 RepID=A0AAN9MZI2_CANGL